MLLSSPATGFLLLVVLAVIPGCGESQSPVVPFSLPEVEFTRIPAQGGAGHGFDVELTRDAGFIVVGREGEPMQSNALVVNLDRNGNTVWKETYGGIDRDEIVCMKRSGDSYVLVGTTFSYGAGSADAWVFVIDESGRVKHEKFFGSTDAEKAESVDVTPDGGFIVAGQSYSFLQDDADIWILKLDAQLNTIWKKDVYGSSFDYAHKIKTTTDGGYIFTGGTATSSLGSEDMWILRFDANGNIRWEIKTGTNGYDEARSVCELPGGRFAVAGFQKDQVSDGIVLIVGPDGSIEDEKIWQTPDVDQLYDIRPVSDGGYILCGRSQSRAWLLRLDPELNTSWEFKYSDAATCDVQSVTETPDGGYIFTGGRSSDVDAFYDFWIVKLAGNPCRPEITRR